MRKFILLFCFSIISISLSFAQGVPNGGFESWVSTKFFDDPNDYNTTNTQYFFLLGEGNVSRDSDAVSGDFAMKLTTKVFFFLPIPAMAVMGELEEGLQNGGFPFSDEPDSFVANLKYELNTDTAYIFVAFKKDGNVIAHNNFQIYGDQTSWKEFRFPLMPFSMTPDSAIIAFMSGHPESMMLTDGSYLMVDNISFTGSAATIPNHDFEIWSEFKTEEPTSWSSINMITAMFGLSPSVTKSTDAHSGQYAMSVKSVDLSSMGGELDTFGMATTGEFGSDGPGGGFPLTTKPDSFSFYYKYNNAANIFDMALVGIFFSKYNSSSQVSETLDSFIWILPAAFNWTRKSVVFSDTTSPDTANIIVVSSNIMLNIKGLGNEIIVDDMVFYYGGVGIPANRVIASNAIYPNPAKDRITVDFVLANDINENVIVRIHNLNGQLVQEHHTGIVSQGHHSYSLNINGLKNGQYLLSITSGNGKGFTSKLLIIQ